MAKKMTNNIKALNPLVNPILDEPTEEEQVSYFRMHAFEGQLEKLGLEVNKTNGKVLNRRRISEVVAQLDDNDFICVGAASSFYFIGTVAEYKEDIALIDMYYMLFGHASTKQSDDPERRTPLSERFVTEIYSRDIPDEPLTKRFTVEGSETGPIWLRIEYADMIRKMYNAIKGQPRRSVEMVLAAEAKAKKAMRAFEIELENEKERNLFLEKFFQEHGSEKERKAYFASRSSLG